MEPLTREEFYEGWDYLAYESEDGGIYFGYGHIDPGQFLASIREYLDEERGFTAEELAQYGDDSLAPYVRHRYAVTVTPASDPDGWRIKWKGVEKEAPRAFPVTVLYL